MYISVELISKILSESSNSCTHFLADRMSKDLKPPPSLTPGTTAAPPGYQQEAANAPPPPPYHAYGANTLQPQVVFATPYIGVGE
jgi:hypothetical protein